MKNSLPDQVFIVGMNGSGTTMLLDHLASHSLWFGFSAETQVLPYFIKRQTTYGDLADDANYWKLWSDLTRSSYRPISERPLINSPGAVSEFLMAHLGGLPHEVFAVLFLDAGMRLIRFEQLFVGSLTQTSVYPREVARRCLQLNAAAIIAAHNHPSGVAEPSRADQLLTTSLRRSLAVLEIELLDHLIVAGDRTVSAGGI